MHAYNGDALKIKYKNRYTEFDTQMFAFGQGRMIYRVWEERQQQLGEFLYEHARTLFLLLINSVYVATKLFYFNYLQYDDDNGCWKEETRRDNNGDGMGWDDLLYYAVFDVCLLCSALFVISRCL